MKPDYKNWMPKGAITGVTIGFVACILLFVVFGHTHLLSDSPLKTMLTIVFLACAVICAAVALWMTAMYRAFSYNGKRQISRHIIDHVAEYVTLPEGGKGLDVGCGSGALTIAVAKLNPQATMVGIDRWGADYSSFSKQLCEDNAKAEGVNNTFFTKGNALKLDFEDESFDAVTSNYVYHNIPSFNRQEILMESLRTLKKGGTFAIHDLFSYRNYGDMQRFIQRLKDMGYEKVELINTANGKWISHWDALWMSLSGSALLVGKK